MQILELNLDIIKYICDKLDLGDLAMFSSSCQSLREFYPSVEAKQRNLKKQVMADICSMMYDCENDKMSDRMVGDKLVRYDRTISGTLNIEYYNADELTDEFAARVAARSYKGNIKYHKFNVTHDRINWNITVYDNVVMKRNTIVGGVCITVRMSAGGMIEIDIDDRYHKGRAYTTPPIWVNYEDTDFWDYPK